MTIAERYEEGIAQGWQPYWVLWCIHTKAEDFNYAGHKNEVEYKQWIVGKHLDFSPKTAGKAKDNDYSMKFIEWLKEKEEEAK